MTSVFIISAPSGSGKSTLANRLLHQVPGLVFSVSYTTRRPRGSEQNTQDYYFISHSQFQRMVERDELLEWAVLFGKDFYGTARRFLDEAIARGLDLVLDIDVQGAAQVKQKLPDAVSTFILPPSRHVLEGRLRRRGQDTDEVIERRLRRALIEIDNYSKYDYVIINDDVDQAAEKLCAIVRAARRTRSHPGAPADPQAKRWLELAEGCRIEKAQAVVANIRQTFSEART